MKIKPAELTGHGFVLLDKLEHHDLVPFIRTYMKKKTKYSVFYYLSNITLLALAGYYFTKGYHLPNYPFGERFIHFSHGLAIAFLLVPLHEYIHVLAYKSQGAIHTSYDVNLKKFYFMALADQFVANKKEFTIVALAPFILISTTLILLSLLVHPDRIITVIGILLAHTAMCSGDFGLLSYMEHHKDLKPVTYDDIENKISYFYGLKNKDKAPF